MARPTENTGALERERAERIEKIRRRLVGTAYDSDRKLREAVTRMLTELSGRTTDR